jgi:YidC/Oxa1 family membrane protein insertase
MKHFNYFLGLNISDTPWNIIKTGFTSHSYVFVILALLIPVISYATQLLSIKLTPQAGNNNQNDQMARQMKTMNLMMPLMSFVICFTVPVGLGFYWICTAVVRSVQQIFINKHIENLDLDDIIKKNEEKAKKKREKMGIYENQIRQAASIKTKSIENKANVDVNSTAKEVQLEQAVETKSNAKAGSMASKANKVRNFNERNSNK